MPRYNLSKIISAIDSYLEQKHRTSIGPVEANTMLAKKRILKDDDTHPGLPLRLILRNGEIPHAYQPGGKGSDWLIPRSKKLTI
jgi:hypothetical protein